MTDTPTLPPEVQQQIDDFRNALAAQPDMLASFDALLPRVVNAIVADLDAQVDTDLAASKIPLSGLAATLIKSAINGMGAKAEAEASAWLDQNLGATS